MDCNNEFLDACPVLAVSTRNLFICCVLLFVLECYCFIWIIVNVVVVDGWLCVGFFGFEYIPHSNTFKKYIKNIIKQMDGWMDGWINK